MTHWPGGNALNLSTIRPVAVEHERATMLGFARSCFNPP
jgi:hypothetical protein